MCGIIGYAGATPALPVVMRGLKQLEYRGYDSAGIAISNCEQIKIIKSEGKIVNLENKLSIDITGNVGIGHTRWATHGKPTELNAHPHTSKGKRVILAHNGIIENYIEIKKELQFFGYKFYSDTDTEVAANLLDFYYEKTKSPVDAINKFVGKVSGSYALAIMFDDRKNEIYAVRKDSPIIIGKGQNGTYLCSDTHSISDYCKEICYPNNFVIIRLTANDIEFFSKGKKRFNPFILITALRDISIISPNV